MSGWFRARLVVIGLMFMRKNSSPDGCVGQDGDCRIRVGGCGYQGRGVGVRGWMDAWVDSGECIFCSGEMYTCDM